jgi:hypothetical protein
LEAAKKIAFAANAALEQEEILMEEAASALKCRQSEYLSEKVLFEQISQEKKVKEEKKKEEMKVKEEKEMERQVKIVMECLLNDVEFYFDD